MEKKSGSMEKIKSFYKNKKVFVTGGATGLGYAMSKKYAQLGATVTKINVYKSIF